MYSHLDLITTKENYLLKIQIEYYATSLLPQLCGLECYRRSKILALIRVRLHPLHNAKNDTFLLSWQFCITHKN